MAAAAAADRVAHCKLGNYLEEGAPVAIAAAATAVASTTDNCSRNLTLIVNTSDSVSCRGESGNLLHVTSPLLFAFAVVIADVAVLMLPIVCRSRSCSMNSFQPVQATKWWPHEPECFRSVLNRL